MSDGNLIGVPKQGQIITVRQLRCIENVRPTTRPYSPLSSRNGLQQLTTGTAMEDQALGQGLQVNWESEPVARIGQEMELPEPADIDPIQYFAASPDALRRGALASVDDHTLQATFQSGIELVDSLPWCGRRRQFRFRGKAEES